MSIHAPHMILGDAQFRYYPLWGVMQNEIFCYICEAFWEMGGDYPLVEDELASEFDDPGCILSLDIETLHKAVAQAEEVAMQYGVLKILIPVHYKTLTLQNSLEIYIRECNKLVWPIFDDVYFEIIKPSNSASREDLTQAFDLIRPFGQGVMLRVDPWFNQFEKIPAETFLSIGVDLTVDPRQEKDVISELKTFSSRAKQFAIPTHVYGLETATLSAAAISAGFDYIGSEIIAKHLEKEGQNCTNDQSHELLRTMLNTKMKGSSPV